MTKSSKYDEEQLAKLGIQMEKPEIDVIDTQSIGTVAASDLGKLAAQEAFMQEAIQIRIATTTDPNAPPYCTVTVNDVNNRVVIPRGRVVQVKRMHVEVLARMKETRYTQPARNPMDPESGNQLIPQHAMVYPFEVVEDKDPAGRAWLERVLAEPA